MRPNARCEVSETLNPKPVTLNLEPGSVPCCGPAVWLAVEPRVQGGGCGVQHRRARRRTSGKGGEHASVTAVHVAPHDTRTRRKCRLIIIQTHASVADVRGGRVSQQFLPRLLSHPISRGAVSF